MTRLITAAERAARRKTAPMRGLGDVIAVVTKAVGIRPCSGCAKRQSALNRLVPFSTKHP